MRENAVHLLFVVCGFLGGISAQRETVRRQENVQSMNDDSYFGTYRPFEFAYESSDGQGTTQHRRELGDASGAVKGSYGYTDPVGLFRIVEYIADQNGFRAVIRTNEPGTLNGNSADAVFLVQPPPQSVSQQLTPQVTSVSPTPVPTASSPVSVSPVSPFRVISGTRPSLVQYSAPEISRYGITLIPQNLPAPTGEASIRRPIRLVRVIPARNRP